MGRFLDRFGFHLGRHLGSFWALFRSRRALGAKKSICRKHQEVLMLFCVFVGRKGPKRRRFGSRRRLLARSKSASICLSILEAKSDQKGSIWGQLGLQKEVQNRRQKSIEKKGRFFPADGCRWLQMMESGGLPGPRKAKA